VFSVRGIEQQCNVHVRYVQKTLDEFLAKFSLAKNVCDFI